MLGGKGKKTQKMYIQVMSKTTKKQNKTKKNNKKKQNRGRKKDHKQI
jgi:hypothetical protein